ncbi:glycosyltransferase [Sphingomonas naphthae]|uniref:Glycosyltransferase n=1 Tax=Sphingomonas naphthae TaxID=1813468 RepID=A0ABY7TNX7_9SPHN|nr:glycosyltransferase [Sphingomonas naphthae]WCT74941.1 glycosyltransferase [Sphingomonas naphthae]
MTEKVGIQSVDLPARSEAEQADFHAAAMAAGQAALERAGAIDHDIAIAGVRIRLRFAGARMVREYLPALAHLLVADAGEPDATFLVWDGESTGIAMPPPPVTRAAFTDRGDIWGMESRHFRSAFHWSDYSVCVLDMETGIGASWIAKPEALPYWARSSPMRTMFHWLLEPRGLHLLHAAVVGDANGGVLITGRGGVGKSTTSLVALAEGMAFAGDDYVVVGFDPEPVAYTLYSTAKLVPKQLDLLPELVPLVDRSQPDTDEKAVIRLYPASSCQIAQGLPLRWLLTPRFGETAETLFEPIAPAELHQAAAFTTMSQLPHAGRATHDFVGALAARLETARIVLGHDVRAVPGALGRLLAGEVIVPAAASHDVRPPLSVIIPVFNGAHFLPQAVQSILAQQYPTAEIIVVDDGSTDDIERVVAALPVEVRFLRQTNAGPASARNRGIRNASGDLIAFLDVDDLWPVDRLASLIAALGEDRDVAIGRGQLARIDPDDPAAYSFVGNPGEAFPYYIGAALYRREAFTRVGLFDEDMIFGEDQDWYRRAEEVGLGVTRVEQISLIVRRHGANMTHGKSAVEMNELRAIKKALERRRAAGLLAKAR